MEIRKEPTTGDYERLADSHKSNPYLRYKGSLFICFFIIGLINNNGYVIIASSAQDMATAFDHKNLMSMFQLCLILFSSLVRVINSKYLLHFRHKSKILSVAIAWTVGNLLYASAFYIDNNSLALTIALTSTLIIGAFTSVGDCTIIGFMKALPPDVISGYSSGTGFAGISGTALYLGSDLLSIPFKYVCLGVIPLFAIYVYCFFYIVHIKGIAETEHLVENKGDDAVRNQPIGIEAEIEDDEAKINDNLSWMGIMKGLKYVGGPITNLAAVYFLEYMCTTSFAERANPSDKSNPNFFIKEAQVLLMLSYQIGVFISRSSLSLFKLSKVFILTSLQLINWLIFASIAYFKWLDIRLQLLIMVWVGLMGGCSYVNCMYLILENKDLEKKDVELTINLASWFNDMGILAASISSLMVSLYIIPDK